MELIESPGRPVRAFFVGRAVWPRHSSELGLDAFRYPVGLRTPESYALSMKAPAAPCAGAFLFGCGDCGPNRGEQETSALGQKLT